MLRRITYMDKTDRKPFVIYPAIDLRGGKVVRLSQGDPERQTTYSEDPAVTARRWLAEGAGWLHVVNLDGAFGEEGPENLQALQAILAVLRDHKPGGWLQLGGGLRDLESIRRALDLGVERVILGTSAVKNPGLVSEAIQVLGQKRIAAGIDVRGGNAAVEGWKQATETTAADLAWNLVERGVRTIIYTDISRDGMRRGADLGSAAALAEETGLEVIAAGGVSSLPELFQARALGLAGAVVGRALYEGQIDLRTALQELA